MRKIAGAIALRDASAMIPLAIIILGACFI